MIPSPIHLPQLIRVILIITLRAILISFNLEFQIMNKNLMFTPTLGRFILALLNLSEFSQMDKSRRRQNIFF